MSERDQKKEEVPVVIIVERRRRQVEFDSAEVMRILRKRAAKGGRRNPAG